MITIHMNDKLQFINVTFDYSGYRQNYLLEKNSVISFGTFPRVSTWRLLHFGKLSPVNSEIQSK